MPLGINDTQHNNALQLCWVWHFVYCHAECYYAGCCILFIDMLSVVMLSVVMLSVVMLSVVEPTKLILSA
jgi:hypothetical protein